MRALSGSGPPGGLLPSASTSSDASNSQISDRAGARGLASSDEAPENVGSDACETNNVPVEMTDEEVLRLYGDTIPRTEDGLLTSVGSRLHDDDAEEGERKCRPCMFNRSKRGCKAGLQCGYCHFPHGTQNKPRLCKGKRLYIRTLLVRAEAKLASDPNALDSIQLPEFVLRNEQLKQEVCDKLQATAERLNAERTDEIYVQLQ